MVGRTRGTNRISHSSHLPVITSYSIHYTKLYESAIAAPGEIDARWKEDEELRLAGFILLTLIPTGIGYVLFKDPIEAAFSDLLDHPSYNFV